MTDQQPENDKLHLWPFVYTNYASGAVGDELRYSIRSLLKWKPEAEVVVVGDRPEWFNGRVIECPRISKREFHSFQDCYFKLRTAAEQIPQYVWMMDDIYWVQNFDLYEAITPKYVRHVSQQRYYAWKPGNAWAKTRARAYDWLLRNNKPTYDFAGHLPQPIRAATFLGMEEELQLAGYYRNWECIYFNSYYANHAIDYGRAYTRVVKKQAEGWTPPRGCIMNHTHATYKGGVEKYLETTFGEPCKYE